MYHIMEDHNYSQKAKKKPFIRKQKIHKCSIPYCGTKKTSFNHLHSVPKTKERLQKWSAVLGIPLSCYMKICSSHFSDEDYIPTGREGKKPNLKRTAIPSRWTHKDGGDIQSSRDTSQNEEIARILKDLETETSDMIISHMESRQLEKDATNILSEISSRDGFYNEISCKIDKIRGNAGNLGPFTLFPDLQDKLFDILELFYGDTFSPDLIFSSILTEVLLESLMKLKNWEETEANMYLRQASLKLKVEEHPRCSETAL